MSVRQQRWDIFCRVVDNYGDIGVCWRLARQLAHEHGRELRLWVDDLTVAAKLVPGLQVDAENQQIDGITVRAWQPAFVVDDVAEVVIEAFACELPDPYLHAMAMRSTAPVWINLDYLTAEAWTQGFHLQPSPHPRWPLRKTFYFPGFDAGTGGLLREQDLFTRRDACQVDTRMRSSAALRVSLFCYPHAPIAALLQSMADSPRAVHCLVPESSILPQIAAFFGLTALHAGERQQKGALTLDILPFLTQDDYDQLLWSCDLNFVRGEDSWIRALWAAKPFVWQPYRQQDALHLVKLQAFLERYQADAVLGQLHAAWAAGPWQTQAWQAVVERLPSLQTQAKQRCAQLAELPDLAAKLVIFCENFS